MLPSSCLVVFARGFALDEDQALHVLSEWNARCDPPWSLAESPSRVNSHIKRSEANRLLAFTWSYPGQATADVEIHLTSEAEGTRVDLEQRSNQTTEWWVGAGAGWESALIRLQLLLDGDDPRNIPDPVFDETLGALWRNAGQA
jgi:hypothetical protein